jgi:hypothetical protein
MRTARARQDLDTPAGPRAVLSALWTAMIFAYASTSQATARRSRAASASGIGR